ncbi:hypothetical protein D3C85_803040 [compost metagenome]
MLPSYFTPAERVERLDERAAAGREASGARGAALGATEGVAAGVGSGAGGMPMPLDGPLS